MRFGNRRNTLCISRFSNRKVGTKDPLSATADLFGDSLDYTRKGYAASVTLVPRERLRNHVAVLLAMTRRGLFRHAAQLKCALHILIGDWYNTKEALSKSARTVSGICSELPQFRQTGLPRADGVVCPYSLSSEWLSSWISS